MAGTARDPGSLRVYARLEAPVLQADGAGGHEEIWQDVAVVPLRLEPVRATSTYSADQQRETVSHRATYRARTDVACGMRFLVRGRKLKIITVRDADETGRFHVALLEESDQ
jgi:SPP1 family predicted phage head-tail adaptor